MMLRPSSLFFCVCTLLPPHGRRIVKPSHDSAKAVDVHVGKEETAHAVHLETDHHPRKDRFKEEDVMVLSS